MAHSTGTGGLALIAAGIVLLSDTQLNAQGPGQGDMALQNEGHTGVVYRASTETGGLAGSTSHPRKFRIDIKPAVTVMTVIVISIMQSDLA
jgi:hypothetical protein